MDKRITIDSEHFDEITELDASNWIVVGLPNGKAAKISRDNLKAFLGTVQTIVPKAIKPTDPAPVIPGIYRPTVSGPYPNLGGLVVDMNGKMNEVLFDGATIANVVTPLPEADTAKDFSTFDESKSASAELSGMLNTYEKLFFSSSRDPFINGNVIDIPLSYIFVGKAGYARIQPTTFDLTPYITGVPSNDRFVIHIQQSNLLKRLGSGGMDVTTADFKVSKWNDGSWMEKGEIVLYTFDRSTGSFKSPFITTKLVDNTFLSKNVATSGSSENDFFLNVADKVQFAMGIEPFVLNDILTWNTGYIFNGTLSGYATLAAGTLDLTPYYETGTISAHRFNIYVNAADFFSKTRSNPKAFTKDDFIVERFNEGAFFNKGNLLLFYWDRSTNTLKTPFFNENKTALGVHTFVKSWYTSRAKFSFDKVAHTFSWDNLLYIFNNGKGTAASTYARINAGSISFAAKVAEFPTAEWYFAYIPTNENFVNGGGSGSVSQVNPEQIIIKAWTEDTSDLRKLYYIPFCLYNKYNGRISSPFLAEVSQTKALEDTPAGNASGAWVNKYPNVYSKLGKFLEKYTGVTTGDADGTASDKTRIIISGNSLMARWQHTSLLGIDPASMPPTMITKNFAAYLWDKLKGQKPTYSRYDKADRFTEVGAWETLTGLATWDDNGDISTETRRSLSTNASISFTVAAGNPYFNFVDRKDSLGTQTATVAVTAGSGFVEVRLEGETSWVEANGYVFSQRNLAANSSLGIGNTQYQRRVEFRKIGAGIGAPQTITISKASANADALMYWGIEEIAGNKPYVQVIDVARGGHTLTQLKYYVQTDVYDRKPDLVVQEIPLLNMIADNPDKSVIVNHVHDFVWGDRAGAINPLSFKAKSNNWQDFNVLLLIPHHSRPHFDSTNKFIVETSGFTAEEIYAAVKGLLYRKGDVAFVDISTAMMSEIDADPLWKGNYYGALTASGITGAGYMNDNLHQNDKGTLVWAKEVCPIFQASTF